MNEKAHKGCQCSNSPYDIMHKKFLEDRKIFLWGGIDDAKAQDIIERLIYLEMMAINTEIRFYINTPGGSVTAAMGIYDTMKLITSPVTVVVTGLAASMGSILLSAPEKGRRFLYPAAQVLIHQPLIRGQLYGSASDITIHAEEMKKTRERLNKILSEASGKSLEQIEKDTDRDYYMTAEEAIDYGLADKIIETFI